MDDGYLGSGKHLKRAIKKYGKDSFEREILYHCSTYKEMVEMEKKVVTKDVCLDENTYNLAPGGKGGLIWMENPMKGREQSDKQKNTASRWVIENQNKLQNPNTEGRKKHREKLKKVWQGRKHKDETKRKIGLANSKRQSGSGNSQYGTMWITDGETNKKVDKSLPLPEGWRKGRVVKNERLSC